MIEKKEGNISLRLPIKLVVLARKCSQAEGKYLSELIRELIEKKLREDGMLQNG